MNEQENKKAECNHSLVKELIFGTHTGDHKCVRCGKIGPKSDFDDDRKEKEDS